MSHTPGHFTCPGEQHSTATHTHHCGFCSEVSHSVIPPFPLTGHFSPVLIICKDVCPLQLNTLHLYTYYVNRFLEKILFLFVAYHKPTDTGFYSQFGAVGKTCFLQHAGYMSLNRGGRYIKLGPYFLVA